MEELSFKDLIRTFEIISDECLEIVENFVEQNYEELTAHHKWMQEYNSWKGDK